MSWFKIKRPVDRDTNMDLADAVNTKVVLNGLGYYKTPPYGEIGRFVDNEMFDALKRFQKDNKLKADSIMKPGGPTEATINRRLKRAFLGTPLFDDDGTMVPGYHTMNPNPPCWQPPQPGDPGPGPKPQK